MKKARGRFPDVLEANPGCRGNNSLPLEATLTWLQEEPSVSVQLCGLAGGREAGMGPSTDVSLDALRNLKAATLQPHADL